MESCSMWLDSRVIVRLLFKCPSSTNHSRVRRHASGRPYLFRTVMESRDTKVSSNRNASSWPDLTTISARPQPDHWRPKTVRTERRVDDQFTSQSLTKSTGTGDAHQPIRASISPPDRFTLLISEFSWVNGNPRFAPNRPVYFMGTFYGTN
ncbi:unnamed protein product [Echinostoma caproni]|uniref:Uncharacterized protein n=1 Tax=Echinostoma caproni TaxID=27848 RepID=A0A183AMY2_9TREM|nr:unnamed protein product [Echinostoma caproni]